MTALVLPLARFQFAFDEDFGAFAQVLTGDACQAFGEDGYGVPFGAFAAFAGCAVFPGFGSSAAQLAVFAAVCEIARFRVRAALPDDNALVLLYGHDDILFWLAGGLCVVHKRHTKQNANEL